MNSTTSNAKRPPRIEKPLRRIVIRGVKSMLTLNPTDKLVYLEILHLDQKQDGCYAGAEIVADRCGLGIRKVEDARRILKARGLLQSAHRPGYRSDTWYASLPIPLPGAILNPTVEQVHELRGQLDQAANSPTESRTPTDNSPTKLRISVDNLGTESRTPNPNSPTESCRSHIKSTEPSTELSTEPRTEPTEVIQEEVVVGWEEKKRRDFREVLGRDPTSVEMELCNPHPTGTDG